MLKIKNDVPLKQRPIFNVLPICAKPNTKCGIDYNSNINKPVLLSSIPSGCYRNIKKNSPYYGTTNIAKLDMNERTHISIPLSQKERLYYNESNR